MEPKKKRRKHRGERVAGNAFMDTVRPAFIRWLALEKWREVEDLRATLGLDLGQAVNEAGRFPGRRRYQRLWVAQWKAEVRPDATGTDSGSVFAAIERATAAAVQEEEAERKLSGDRPFEEDPEYKAFVDRNLERLLRQGELG
ncbi:MAG: hypothetical protein ACREQ2_05345 [Candidatus Binatia bacterium]